MKRIKKKKEKSRKYVSISCAMHWQRFITSAPISKNRLEASGIFSYTPLTRYKARPCTVFKP